MSKDFFSINKKNKWITNQSSRKIVHLLRNKYDCILSTSKSINKDNSLLNCRIDGLNNYKPDLFIIDLNLKLKKKLLLNNLITKRKTFIVTSQKNKKKILSYKKLGYKIIFVKGLNNKKDFDLLSNKIYEKGYSRVLIESGLTFLNFLLNFHLINVLYIFKSNNKLSKNGKNNDTIANLKKISTKFIQINLNDDKLLKKEF